MTGMKTDGDRKAWQPPLLPCNPLQEGPELSSIATDDTRWAGGSWAATEAARVSCLDNGHVLETGPVQQARSGTDVSAHGLERGPNPITSSVQQQPVASQLTRPSAEAIPAFLQPGPLTRGITLST